ncbi:MAG: class I SAM-dependent methyltransferase [Sandaracinaceae bacterium]
MLDAMDWDVYWRFEAHRRAADPLDFRRWKRDSQRGLRSLYPDGAPLLLDSTAGMGDHTVNLAEAGFTVEACDRSAVARAATQDAVRVAGLNIPIFDADWRELKRPGRYEIIFNDELHSIDDPSELDAVLRGLFEALTPGGALVFFFADEAHPEPGHGAQMRAWDEASMERARIAWDHEVGGRRVTLTKLARFRETCIDEDHVYVSRDGEGPATLETLTMRRVYRWDWAALAPRMRAVGFEGLRSDHFENVKGYTFALSRAFRP